MFSAVMRALRASHGLRTLPFNILPKERLALAWVGLLVGILVLALHGAAVAGPASARPGMLMDDPIQAAANFVRLKLISSQPVRLGGCDDDEGNVE
jgi:hypothetical protein